MRNTRCKICRLILTTRGSSQQAAPISTHEHFCIFLQLECSHDDPKQMGNLVVSSTAQCCSHTAVGLGWMWLGRYVLVYHIKRTHY